MAMIGNGMFGQEWEKLANFDIAKDAPEISVKSIHGGGMIVPVSVDKRIRKKVNEVTPMRALMEYVVDE